MTDDHTVVLMDDEADEGGGNSYVHLPISFYKFLMILACATEEIFKLLFMHHLIIGLRGTE